METKLATSQAKHLLLFAVCKRILCFRKGEDVQLKKEDDAAEYIRKVQF